MSEYNSDKWLTSTPEDRDHDSWCHCDECHRTHYLRDNFDDINFGCCTDEVDYLISIGKWCVEKPKKHADIFMFEGVCEECENEKEVIKTTILSGTHVQTARRSFTGRLAIYVRQLFQTVAGKSGSTRN